MMMAGLLSTFESHKAERALFWWQEDPGPSPSSARMSYVTSIPALSGSFTCPIYTMVGLGWDQLFSDSAPWSSRGSLTLK